jgi:hypothetical protein
MYVELQKINKFMATHMDRVFFQKFLFLYSSKYKIFSSKTIYGPLECPYVHVYLISDSLEYEKYVFFTESTCAHVPKTLVAFGATVV